MKWHIGQKVVCIDDTPRAGQIVTGNIPKKDVIYTIRGIYESKKQPGQIALILNEITNDIHPTLGHERGFYAWRFRPVDEDWAEGILNKVAEEIEEEVLAWITE
jgi:hypothetical protein